MMYAGDEFYDDDMTSGPYDDYDGDPVTSECPHWRGPEFCDHSCETDD